ncbi:hypothetical protein EJM73_08860 [Clostridium botulinum]|uniref:hypothetical protein n=1 Tax=Clostridium botulinum TaxID=1491 RepID=UPI0013756363|nr:hypothetical protein [Clostridium botulinum]NCI19734.1 hypothetical protein [Clostridium botulinum]NCI35772.1 hypothetical protein [Clostridium botulinum]NCI71629.1 hypothetical protein [Clostridium botulinum]NDI38821.1 hypothetical protein [Clostridium botulinum]
MRILDYTNKKLENEIDCGRNTVMIMPHLPKIIVFENVKELNKFQRVWEDVIQEYTMEDTDSELFDKYPDDLISWYIDPFEEESFLFEDLDVESRCLKIVPVYEKEDECFSNKMEVKFGVLNSCDIYTDMDTLEKHCELIEILLTNEKLKDKCAKDTLNMFEIILSVWREQLAYYKEDNCKYFKIKVIDD